MSSVAEMLIDLEKKRLRALVDADAPILDALHAPEFVLVHPGGGTWSREQYVGGIQAGTINYRQFDAISEIEVLVDHTLAVLRYRSAIDIHVQGQEAGPLQCWHTDCYRAADGAAMWQVVWSQATEIQAETKNDSDPGSSMH